MASRGGEEAGTTGERMHEGAVGARRWVGLHICTLNICSLDLFALPTGQLTPTPHPPALCPAALLSPHLSLPAINLLPLPCPPPTPKDKTSPCKLPLTPQPAKEEAHAQYQQQVGQDGAQQGGGHHVIQPRLQRCNRQDDLHHIAKGGVLHGGRGVRGGRVSPGG